MFRAGMFGPRLATVPSVTGLSWSEAKQQLERIGFRAVLASGPSEGKSTIVEQDPISGSRIKLESTVRLRSTRVKARVPGVVGLDTLQAGDALRAAGFVIAPPIERAGPFEERGKVVAQIPEAGALEDEGTTVTVVIGI
jgi:beta-lactam-binding protein with PASTA domain